MDERDYQIETLAIRAGQERSQFGEHSEALYLTSSFVFDNAEQAARRFAGEEEGNVYARFSNPTVTMFQERLAALEGAEDCVATASGMSAIMALCLAHLQAGDHIVASSALFGATVQLFNNILSRCGISTSFVPPTDPAAWTAAVRPNTRLFFVETPSNPLTEIADIAALAEIAHARGILLAVDNCFCTPVLQRPLELGADLVVHSATKYLDGQGRVLGGAVCGARKLTEEIFKYLRTAGPTLSAFNAWVLLKGLETIDLRVRAQAAGAEALIGFLKGQKGVSNVRYPFDASHPQAALARSQMSGGGTIVTFDIDGGRERAFRFADALALIDISNNLGDAKSLLTHPDTTTHARLPEAERRMLGITEGMFRLSVGLEDPEDLMDDIGRALKAAG